MPTLFDDLRDVCRDKKGLFAQTWSELPRRLSETTDRASFEALNPPVAPPVPPPWDDHWRRHRNAWSSFAMGPIFAVFGGMIGRTISPSVCNTAVLLGFVCYAASASSHDVRVPALWTAFGNRSQDEAPPCVERLRAALHVLRAPDRSELMTGSSL